MYVYEIFQSNATFKSNIHLLSYLQSTYLLEPVRPAAKDVHWSAQNAALFVDL